MPDGRSIPRMPACSNCSMAISPMRVATARRWASFVRTPQSRPPALTSTDGQATPGRRWCHFPMARPSAPLRQCAISWLRGLARYSRRSGRRSLNEGLRIFLTRPKDDTGYKRTIVPVHNPRRGEDHRVVTDGAALLGITIRDVAREAGVSTATVSRALRGLPNVDPVTREHVRRVADRLDYVISPAASRLASGRAGSIAVITPFLGPHSVGVSSVSIDDVEGGRMASQHLINLGHERIGLISGRPLPTPFFPENDRLAGYRQALEASGLSVEASLQVPGYFTIEGGEHAMTAQLAQRTPPTAVFAMSDEMAFGALRALRRHGIRPGLDIALVGFDGHEMCDMLDLTTVTQPAEELGSAAARCLLDLLDDPAREPEVLRLPTQLCVRGPTTMHRTVA